jgi:hypothetical protein
VTARHAGWLDHAGAHRKMSGLTMRPAVTTSRIVVASRRRSMRHKSVPSLIFRSASSALARQNLLGVAWSRGRGRGWGGRRPLGCWAPWRQVFISEGSGLVVTDRRGGASACRAGQRSGVTGVTSRATTIIGLRWAPERAGRTPPIEDQTHHRPAPASSRRVITVQAYVSKMCRDHP